MGVGGSFANETEPAHRKQQFPAPSADTGPAGTWELGSGSLEARGLALHPEALPKPAVSFLPFVLPPEEKKHLQSYSEVFASCGSVVPSIPLQGLGEPLSYLLSEQVSG